MMNNLGNKETMSKNIKKYMANRNVTASDVCKALSIPMPTFSDWLHAKTYPRIDKIEKLANYFGVTKADLVEDEQPTREGELSEREIEFIRTVRQLPDEVAEQFLGVLKTLLNKR